MRSSQCLETHLKRQRDLAGTRGRISRRRSSVSLSAAVPLEEAQQYLHRHRWRGGQAISKRRKLGVEACYDGW
jgi:hypothetical protein